MSEIARDAVVLFARRDEKRWLEEAFICLFQWTDRFIISFAQFWTWIEIQCEWMGPNLESNYICRKRLLFRPKSFRSLLAPSLWIEEAAPRRALSVDVDLSNKIERESPRIEREILNLNKWPRSDKWSIPTRERIFAVAAATFILSHLCLDYVKQENYTNRISCP